VGKGTERAKGRQVMASVSKQPNGRWLVRYWTPDGGQRKRRFDRATDARNFAYTIEASKATGTFVDPHAGRTRLSEWAKRWLEGVRPDPETGEAIKPKTFASYESLLRSRVLPAFGRRQLATLKPSDVQTWINKMQAEGLSPSRVRQAHVLLKQMLDAALRDRMLGMNAALGVKLPKLQHREAAYFEPAVVDRIADATPEPYDVLVTVLGIVGLRFGEGVALRRRHVDLMRRRLLVEDSLAEISGDLVFGPTKTHAMRSVPRPTGLCRGIGAPPRRAGWAGGERSGVHRPEGGAGPLQQLRGTRVEPCTRGTRHPPRRPSRPAALRRGPDDRRARVAEGGTEGARASIGRLHVDGVRAHVRRGPR
jgi:hypothetical protein